MADLVRILCLLLFPVIVVSKPGFLLTAPPSLTANSQETFYLTLYDVPSTGNVVVTLQQRVTSYYGDGSNATNFTLQTATQAIDKPSPPEGQTVQLSISIPGLTGTNGGQTYLIVEGDLGDYSFTKESSIQVNPTTNIVFIESDKPIYKPGQNVQVRILPVSSELIPLGGRPGRVMSDIWIMSPSQIRLAQWLNLTYVPGMEQIEMMLSDSAELGYWTIYVNTTAGSNTQLDQQSFQVAEYVLPKFEVAVTPQPFALANADNINWNICAKYTYGKLVKGNVTIVVGYNVYSNFYPRRYYYGSGNNYPQIVHSEKINGCINYTVSQTDLMWLNYPGNDIILLALVTEDGTDVQQNSSATISLSNTPLQLAFTNAGYNNGYFKPGIPYFGQVSASNPDNTVRAGELLELCAVYITETKNSSHRLTDTGLVCNNYTTDDQGLFNFTLPPTSQSVVSIALEVNAINFPAINGANNYELISQPSASLQLNPWYSPSNSYLQIVPVFDTTACGVNRTIMVYFNIQTDETLNIYTQIFARGEIISEQMSVETFSDSNVKLVPDQSYLTDSFNSVLLNQSNSSPTLGKMSITVTADYKMSPQASILVYYTKSDREIIADSFSLNIAQCLKNKVSMEFLSQEEAPGTEVGVRVTASPQSICGVGAVDKSVYLLSSGNLLSMDSIFNSINSGNYYSSYDSDCITVTDPGFPSDLIGSPYNNFADSLTAFQNGNFLVLTDMILVTKPCPINSYPPPIYHGGRFNSDKEYAGAGAAGGGEVPAPSGAAFNGANQDSASDSGSAASSTPIRTKFPETWLWEMDMTDASGVFTAQRTLPDTITEWVGSAVCLHPEDGLGVSLPANITAFLPFFVSATLPYSVIRGEITPVIITVFNYVTGCLPITLTLDEDQTFKLSSGSLTQSLCVCGGDSATYNYLVQPLTIGTLNFTIHAASSSDNSVCGTSPISNVTAQDAETVSIIVEPEGFKHQESFSNFSCPSQDKGTFTTTYTLTIPEDAVNGSAKAQFLTSGDLLGRALQNINNLVEMPYGCGEQNMASFLPDVFILDYLTQSGQLDQATRDRLLQYLQAGYQRELSYQRVDGSYSAFGQNDDSGSLWLTAFVVKGYAGASRYIFVDQSDISQSVAWIQSQQNSDDGCFPQIGQLFDTAMEGGSKSNLGSKATLTSYVLISLLEANVSVDPNSVKLAQSCLAKETNPTTYTLALMTYASCLSGDSQAQSRLDALVKLAVVQGGLEYWLDDSTNSLAIQVETASYAILSLLTCGGGSRKADALPVVRWLVQQMNANGGFVSTQDTVMALQALAKYSSNIDKDPVNMDISMVAENIAKSYHIQEDNKYLVQMTELPTVPTTVNVTATGSGCSLLQTTLLYNSALPPNYQAFTLIITPIGVGKSNCEEADLTFCMSYNYDKKFSNMAVLNLRLPSGYNLDTSNLNRLYTDNKLNFRKYETTGSNVAFYFEKVGPSKQCFTVTLDKTFDVKNLQPGTASLYDYYNPDHQITTSYKINNTCT